LSQLNEEIIRCQDCELSRQRLKAVPGEGSESAAIMFVGEAPGWHEDQQGRPFVGPAGHFLDELLGSIGMRRQDVYIANVIKCRPPQNRDPLPSELKACRKWLDRQIELIQPRMIVTLGRYSLAQLLPGETIAKAHGKAKKKDGIIYFAMYHPAAALHQGSLRKVIMEDMLKIPVIMAQEAQVKAEAPQPEQLSMF
jgi:DNA polymerase